MKTLIVLTILLIGLFDVILPVVAKILISGVV